VTSENPSIFTRSHWVHPVEFADSVPYKFVTFAAGGPGLGFGVWGLRFGVLQDWRTCSVRLENIVWV
jgi:hypothetical protein